MRTSLFTFLLILISATLFAQSQEYIYLSGRVKDDLTKTDLTNAYCILFDSVGEPRDSIQCNRGIHIVNGERVPMAIYGFPVTKADSTYVFDIVCEGYEPQTIVYKVEKVGRREERREIPMTFLKRAPIKLGEVTVKASKVKFYNKGDTLVFNADAFNLAEGSMLDGLISQLPGVELNEDGQIKVNGEYVESLLLNGKQFLDGNNQLMLENIAAYTVKNVEVYRGQTDKQKWENDTTQLALTMDVKLKKEYNVGWLINAQGGGGTEGLYMGRLFASWFNPNSNVTLLGNINNLNDNRKPGKSDSWTPDRMPSGTRTYKMGAINYDHRTGDETFSINGHATFEQTTTNNSTTTARTNFFNTGDTYENSWRRNYDRDMKAETRHYVNWHNDKSWFGAMAVGRYKRRDTHGDNLSGSFTQEQKDLTFSALEALYTATSQETLDAVINRANTRSQGKSREYEIQVFPGFTWKVPRTGDRINDEFGVKYINKKDNNWRDYVINYGADPTPAVRKLQYIDNQPNHTLTLMNSLEYSLDLSRCRLSIEYDYRFEDTWRDSRTFALDRLTEMGIFGELPEGYTATLDPDNSYTSHQMRNKHSVRIHFSYGHWNNKNENLFNMVLAPELGLTHDHMDYRRAGILYPIRRDFKTLTLGRYGANFDYMMKAYGEGRRRQHAHYLNLSFEATPKTPNLLDLVDIVNDSDPLNISEGNSGLRPQTEFKNKFSWRFNPNRAEHRLSNMVNLSANFTHDAIVRGYTYDSSTGVRHNRSYNVQGNRSFMASNFFNLSFGKRDCLTLSLNTSATSSRYVDMIGLNTDTPTRSKVDNIFLNQRLDLMWNFGKQTLRVQGAVTQRHSSSDREDFRVIDAQTYQAGLIGQFRLPAGFGIDTDLTLYTRRGYGVKELDTSDLIWNIRCSWTPKKSHWSVFLDGFDLLHQLSNVNYGISATGRTVSYTNALPRYFLLTAQYRLSLQPKLSKKK